MRKVSASSFISCLDASSGYNQIQMAPEDIYKTGFVCFRGFYEFMVLPFGLKCSGSTFVRVMAEVLKDHSEYAGPFVDDTAVHSLWWRDHLTHLENVFSAYEGVGMTLKLSKCKFAMPRVDFLGHNVGSGSLSVQESKVAAIVSLPEPTSKKLVRSFLGMCAFYKNYIANYQRAGFASHRFDKVLCGQYFHTDRRAAGCIQCFEAVFSKSSGLSYTGLY